MRLSKFPKSMMAYITENGDLEISLVSALDFHRRGAKARRAQRIFLGVTYD